MSLQYLMADLSKYKFCDGEGKIFSQVKRVFGLSYFVLVNFQNNLIGSMRPIFMALYAQSCDFYIQMYKQYFQIFKCSSRGLLENFILFTLFHNWCRIFKFM